MGALAAGGEINKISVEGSLSIVQNWYEEFRNRER